MFLLFSGLCKGKSGCCTSDSPCTESDGTCDNDDQCAGSLVCGSTNCQWGNCCQFECPEMNIAYAGSDHWSGHTDTWHICGVLCSTNYTQICALWTYRESDKKCYIKTEGGIVNRGNAGGHVSGRKGCPGNYFF